MNFELGEGGTNMNEWKFYLSSVGRWRPILSFWGVGMIIPGTLRWYRLKKLKPRIESVYKDLKRVVEPETLDQDHLGEF